MKKKLYKAIQWFIATINGNGLDCEESEVIRSLLTSIFVNMLEDGIMIWDAEMVEEMYPQAVDQIRRKEREKIFNEIRYIVNDLNRRLDNGK